MDVLELRDKAEETRREIELLIKEIPSTKPLQKEIDKFINTRFEELEEFLSANNEGRGEILLRLSSEERKHLLGAAFILLERAGKFCGALVKISFQSADKSPDKLFSETDLLSIVVDIMN
ncbi:MAG TPA: hypothetical protein PLT92_13575 [Ignavibacteriaceae bacterium]|nr:hypothetical protein [Ignavibacteriaceae bacterium]